MCSRAKPSIFNLVNLKLSWKPNHAKFQSTYGIHMYIHRTSADALVTASLWLIAIYLVTTSQYIYVSTCFNFNQISWFYFYSNVFISRWFIIQNNHGKVIRFLKVSGFNAISTALVCLNVVLIGHTGPPGHYGYSSGQLPHFGLSHDMKTQRF
jgi:hypothetical protein